MKKTVLTLGALIFFSVFTSCSTEDYDLVEEKSYNEMLSYEDIDPETLYSRDGDEGTTSSDSTYTYNAAGDTDPIVIITKKD